MKKIKLCLDTKSFQTKPDKLNISLISNTEVMQYSLENTSAAKDQQSPVHE